MKYQIVGAMRVAQETKKGKKFRIFSVIPVLKDDRWIGLPAEQITLWDSVLSELDIQTESGECYAKDDKKYYIELDYNRNGYIISAKIYNG